MEKFDKLISLVLKEVGSDIKTIVRFGSKIGLEHPRFGDIDLIIVSRSKKSISKVMKTFRRHESEVFGKSHSAKSDFIQRNFFGATDLTGLHLIIFSEDEFDARFNLKSLRLKIFTSILTSKELFLFNLKRNYEVIYGHDLVSKLKIGDLSLVDRILTFPLSYFILLVLPVLCHDRNSFRIWCFKAIKYSVDNIVSYTELKTGKKINPSLLNYDMVIYDLCKKYRYEPHKYHGSLFTLYFKCWLNLLKNTSFILRGVQLRDQTYI